MIYDKIFTNLPLNLFWSGIDITDTSPELHLFRKECESLKMEGQHNHNIFMTNRLSAYVVLYGVIHMPYHFSLAFLLECR